MAQFTNQAQLSYNNSVVSSNVAVGEILEVLSADKNAVVNTYTQGDGVTYVVSAVNAGTTPTSGITVSETVTPLNAPELTITKSITPVPVTENGIVTYTFVIQNYGNTAANTDANVTVTDTFDPILSDPVVTLNGAPLAQGSGYTYVATDGQFATVPGVITVPAATYTQTAQGAWTVTPGTATLTVSGTI
jgi:uncharacterized repeat protein (TIGR01451 family)